MNIVAVSETGELGPVCERLKNEGHRVLLVIEEPAFKDRFEGLIEKPSYMVPGRLGVAKRAIREIDPDIVLTDMGEAEKLTGKKVVGASLWGDALFASPSYGLELLESCGIAGDELIRFNHHNGEWWLSAWWTGATFTEPLLLCLFRGLMDGGKGARVLAGASGYLLQSPHDTDLYQRLVPLMRKVKHIGPVYLLVNKPRHGEPVIRANGMLVDYALRHILYRGEVTRTITPYQSSTPTLPKEHWTVAVRVTLPPFPYGSEAVPRGASFQKPALKYLWLVDHDKDRVAVTNGDIGWATARGHDIYEARRRAYRTITNLPFAELQYRNDIGLVSRE